MVLLRASSEAIGEEADLSAAVGRRDTSSVPHSELLVRFAEAGTRGSDDLAEARAALMGVLEPAAFVEAAATVGIFNGLVRTADATGIPLDDGTLRASAGLRGELGLNEYAGAQASDLSAAANEGAADDGAADDVGKLFGFR